MCQTDEMIELGFPSGFFDSDWESTATVTEISKKKPEVCTSYVITIHLQRLNENREKRVCIFSKRKKEVNNIISCNLLYGEFYSFETGPNI